MIVKKNKLAQVFAERIYGKLKLKRKLENIFLFTSLRGSGTCGSSVVV